MSIRDIEDGSLDTKFQEDKIGYLLSIDNDEYFIYILKKYMSQLTDEDLNILADELQGTKLMYFSLRHNNFPDREHVLDRIPNPNEKMLSGFYFDYYHNNFSPNFPEDTYDVEEIPEEEYITYLRDYVTFSRETDLEQLAINRPIDNIITEDITKSRRGRNLNPEIVKKYLIILTDLQISISPETLLKIFDANIQYLPFIDAIIQEYDDENFVKIYMLIISSNYNIPPIIRKWMLNVFPVALTRTLTPIGLSRELYAKDGRPERDLQTRLTQMLASYSLGLIDNLDITVDAISRRSYIPPRRTTPQEENILINLNRTAVYQELPEGTEDSISYNIIDGLYYKCKNEIVPHYFEAKTIRDWCLHNWRYCDICQVDKHYQINPTLYTNKR